MPPKTSRRRSWEPAKEVRGSLVRPRRRRRQGGRCPPNYCNSIEAGCEVVQPGQFVCRCPRDLHIVQPGEPCIYDDPSAARRGVTRITTDTVRVIFTTAAPVVPGRATCPNPTELCGMEAACEMDSVTGRHICTCPHGITRPTGDRPENFKCERNVLENTMDPPPIPLNISGQDKNGEAVSATGVPGWVLVLVPGLSALLILAVFSLVCWRWRKGRSRASNQKLDERKMNLPIAITEDIDLDDRVHSNPNYYHESPTASPLEAMKVTHIPKEQIIDMSEIGQGQFGKVYKGVYLPAEGEPVNVAVKLLKETANEELQDDFIREVEIMASCQHRNIVTLLGVLVQDSGVTPWMVFEYMAFGDLAELLRKNAPKWGSPQGSPLDMTTLHSFAEQVASGMAYLASQHFVHRDLACRNILVGENMVVKISDFGMSRDIYTCDYYKVAGGSRMLPVRWMAPESISYGKFTLESDIWSYGVVLWEIYAYGKQPYYGHSNKEVVSLILRHILLIPPESCPSAVCDVMDSCWRSEPCDRTNFEEIAQKLAQMSDAMRRHGYVNLDDTVPYAELDYDLDLLDKIEADVKALRLDDDGSPEALDEDMYLQPNKAPTGHDYIQPIP